MTQIHKTDLTTDGRLKCEVTTRHMRQILAEGLHAVEPNRTAFFAVAAVCQIVLFIDAKTPGFANSVVTTLSFAIKPNATN